MGAYGEYMHQQVIVDQIREYAEERGYSFKDYHGEFCKIADYPGNYDTMLKESTRDYNTQFVIGYGVFVHHHIGFCSHDEAGNFALYPIPSYFRMNHCSAMPPSAITKLNHLNTIDVQAMGSNLLWMGDLRKLEAISIRDYNSEQLPEDWMSVSTLRILHLFYSKKAKAPLSLPRCIRHFRNLENLVINTSSNVLELPDWLHELPNLSIIDLRNSSIKNIPYSLVRTKLPFVLKGEAVHGVLLDGTQILEGDLSLFAKSWDEINNSYIAQLGLKPGDFFVNTEKSANIGVKHLQDIKSEDMKNYSETAKNFTDTAINIGKIIGVLLLIALLVIGVVKANESETWNTIIQALLGL